jgi:hypothetical protein
MPRSVVAAWLLALLIGVVAGLRTMTAPTGVSWAAHLGWLDLRGTWLAFLGYAWTPWILSVLALAGWRPHSVAVSRPRGIVWIEGAQSIWTMPAIGQPVLVLRDDAQTLEARVSPQRTLDRLRLRPLQPVRNRSAQLPGTRAALSGVGRGRWLSSMASRRP